MFKSKKADESLGLSWRTLISMVLIIEIFLGFMTFIYAIKSGNRFEIHFLSRDIATVIDTVTISPGDIIIDYPRDTKNLGIQIEKEKVLVYKLPKFTSPPETYLFSEDRNLIYDYAELVPSGDYAVRPRFVKQGDNINILEKEYSFEEAKNLVCVDVPGRQPLKTKGSLVNTIVEYTKDLALLGDTSFQSDAPLSDVVVLITEGDDFDETNNPINAYIHVDSAKSHEAKFLACLIINKILESGKINELIAKNSLADFTSANIFPTDKYSINYGNLAIVLETGNQHITKEENILFQPEFPAIIKEAVNQAIDTYG